MKRLSKYVICTTALLTGIIAVFQFGFSSIVNGASSYYWQNDKGQYCIFTDDNNNNIKCFTNYDSVDKKGRYCFHFDVESKDKNGQKKVEKDVIKCYTPNKDDAETGDATELTAGEKCTDMQGANVQNLTTNELLHSQAGSLCGVSPVSTETKERGYQLAAAQESPIKICAYETANNESTTYLIPFSPEDDGSYYLILIPSKNHSIFAVFFPPCRVVVLDGRQPVRVLRLAGRKKSSQIYCGFYLE